MAKRNKGIIAYGTELDRAKIAALAMITKRSVSDWVIEKIQEEYRAAFGDTDPARITSQQ